MLDLHQRGGLQQAMLYQVSGNQNDMNLKDCVAAADGRVRWGHVRVSHMGTLGMEWQAAVLADAKTASAPMTNLASTSAMTTVDADGGDAGEAAQGRVGVGSGSGAVGGQRLGNGRHEVPPCPTQPLNPLPLKSS